MSNWNNEDALIEILVGVLDVGKKRLLVQPQIVAVEPINEL